MQVCECDGGSVPTYDQDMSTCSIYLTHTHAINMSIHFYTLVYFTQIFAQADLNVICQHRANSAHPHQPEDKKQEAVDVQMCDQRGWSS